MAALPRLQRLQHTLDQEKTAALLVSNPYNIRYLTGFIPLEPMFRESLLLVTPKNAYLLISPLYSHQSDDKKAYVIHYLEPKQNYYQKIAALLTDAKIKTLHVEARDIHYAETEILMKLIPHLTILTTPTLIEEQRVIKDDKEIKAITQACTISDRVFNSLLSNGIPSSSKGVEHIIENLTKECGGEDTSFKSIVANNKYSAIAHGSASSKLIKPGVLLMDFGALFQGYASDMTRTVLIEPTNKWKHLSLFKEYYSLLKAIQQLCIAELRIGMSGEDMHNTATKELKKIKLDTYFIHSLGHGVGLQIHENPRLSPSSAHILQENMVVTIEPGIYLPGKFGIRIEDTVLITKKGAKQLTKSTKNLSSLHIK